MIPFVAEELAAQGKARYNQQPCGFSGVEVQISYHDTQFAF